LAVIVGLISKSVASAGISRQLNRTVAKLGSGTILSAKDYLGFSFLFFVLAAGANTLPVALLFLGLVGLAYATFRRATEAIAYRLVTVVFLWQLFAALLGAPRWLVDVTPFAQIGLVPAQTFRGGAAAVMLAIGSGATVVARLCFERRDLAGP
jgi:putative exporter of polyketide antibiotics